MALIPFLVIKTLLLGNIFTFFQGTALCRQNQHTDLVNLLVSQAKSTTTSESVQSRDHFWFCTASACHALTVRVTVGSLCTTYLYLRICWSRLCFTAIIITRTPLLVHINKQTYSLYSRAFSPVISRQREQNPSTFTCRLGQRQSARSLQIASHCTCGIRVHIRHKRTERCTKRS